MKLPRPRLAMAIVAALALGAQLPAQTAPAPSAAGATDQTPVKLDPFSVSAASDVGFVAANSLAGGRIATALKDTPVAYSVLTSEFLEAFNINDTGKAAEFSVNTTNYVNDGLNGVSGSTTIQVRIRGQNANTPTRNFFPLDTANDAYNTDRIDFARGANASLFGAGGSSGTQNTVSKQAMPTRTMREVRVQVGSWDRYRMTVDLNQPLNEKSAVRANLLWSTNKTFRLYESELKRGITLAGTYNVTPKFSIRGEYEYRVTDKVSGTNRSKDNISAWDGKFTASGPNAAMTAAQMAAAGVVRKVRSFVIDPEHPFTAMNWLNHFTTKAAVHNTNPTLNNFMNGKPIRSIGLNFNDGAGMPMTEVWDHVDRFASARVGTPHFWLPSREFTPLWETDKDYPTSWERVTDMSLFFTYRPFENFFVELSGDRNRVYRWTEYTAANGMYNFEIDINRLKPDGTVNPYFLQPFSEMNNFSFDRNPLRNSVNLQSVYVKDTRWGRLQAGVMGGLSYEDRRSRQYFMLFPLHQGVIPGSDLRAFFPAPDRNQQAPYTRLYPNLRGTVPVRHPEQQAYMVSDPTVGTRASITPRWYIQPNRTGPTGDVSRRFNFLQLAANMNLFKNRLVLIGAFRRDTTLLADRHMLTSDDQAADWDGLSNRHKPAPPDNYWQLRFTPKNAAGVATGPNQAASARPRTPNAAGVLVRQPQYANETFQDDFHPPDIRTGVNTRSFGAVVNVTSWLGLYANDSTTFDLGASNLNVYRNLIPNTKSQSYDAGVRVTLPNGKLALSAGWYRAYQEGGSVGVPGGFFGTVNQIANTPVIGDLSEQGRNIRSFEPYFGFGINTTRTTETTGLELEMTANLTSKWRLIINAAENEPVQKNVAPDVPAWFAEYDPVIRQIAADAGILINAQNQASINPAVNDPSMINITRINASVTAFNNYYNTTVPTVLAEGRLVTLQTGGPSWTGNVATDYRFDSGWFKGLRAGIAINYRGRQILGNTIRNSIPDPNNPNNAILAPDALATNYLWVGGYTKGTANFSYTYRFKENSGRFSRYAPKTVQFDLSIDNLFDMRRPVLENSTTGNSTANALQYVPRNNDVSNPGIMAVPGAYNFQPERNYTLTAKLSF
jgi:hypothetical protein